MEYKCTEPTVLFLEIGTIFYDGLKSIATIYREPTALKFSGTEILMGGAIFNRAISGE